MRRPQVELLAPASGMEAVRGAVYAGADAVYTGGARFGARAYADNLVEEELLSAIDFVHLHGKQLYLTVNTLLKERELEHSLTEYLMPYYRHGLDAVIVQDIGVFQAVKENFPDLPVHVSTQAVVTGKNSAAMWERLGASRIVTARELSLEEIQIIRENTSIEIESFVHGALCYCYSGQCLFSSFLGGRSGNRGRCAQPCRLPYELTDEKGNVLSKEEGKKKDTYLLSPKDMCTLDILPDIIEAGVFSLKIEGRMKRAEYTAGVTEIYRKYIDIYMACKEAAIKQGEEQPSLSRIKEQYHVSQEDKQRLMDLYNRGNFHSGYYVMHNGTEMMSMERPNHNGVWAGTMKKGKKGYSMKSQIELHRQDVLEFRGVADKQKKSGSLELIIERDVKSAEIYVLPDKYAFLLGKRQSVEVCRTKNAQLLQELYKKYIQDGKQIAINGSVHVTEGRPLELTIWQTDMEQKVMSTPDKGVQAITVTGDIVEAARKQPAQQDDIRKQTAKTGNTPFRFEQLEVELQGNCFVSVKALNQLRRKALESLETAITQSYRREVAVCKKNTGEESFASKPDMQSGQTLKAGYPNCHVSVEELKQLPPVLAFERADIISVSIHAFFDDYGKINQIKEQCHQAGKKFYLVLPHIWRKAVEEKIAMHMQEILQEIDGIVVKNMEVLSFVNSYHPTVDVVLDYTSYTMNVRAARAWREAGATTLTLPVELNKGELQALINKQEIENKQPVFWEMIVYGHLPMMVSAQCPVKNTTGCQKKPVMTSLKDRKGSCHYVKNYCDTCYTVIYNSEPLVLTDLQDELQRMNICSHRLLFTVETEEEIKQVLAMYTSGTAPVMTYTRGHWKRGVE